ncbi:MAG TPA: hypothetical protein VMT19_08025 [Thermoanaerobaculaceae bacterium]|nr:hypothetical protein [Thermoanaerobaculaceae bacterium]
MAALRRIAPCALVAAASLAVILAVLPATAAPIWSAAALAIAVLYWVQRREAAASRAGWWVDGLALGIPIALMLGLYRHVVRTWWLGDDPAIVWAVASHGIAPHFWSPGVWREFSSANFTPMEILSFGIDWRLFGLEPAGYYWHHLASLALVLVLAFVVLRRFAPAATASVSLCLFVASAPVATVAQQLMTRHYVEGLALALAATILFLRTVERPGAALGWVGGVAYLAACAAKEVLVPLVVVLPFLPVGDARTRLRALRPYLLALAVYVPWRVWMLGPAHIVTGYGTLFSGAGASSPGDVAARAVATMGWGPLAAAVVAATLACLVVGLAVRRAGASLLLAAAMAAAAAGPLVPVLALLDPRMLLIASFGLALGMGASVGLLGDDRWHGVAAVAASAALMAVGVAAVVGSPLWAGRRNLDRYRVEGTAVLTGSPDLPLFHPAGPPWFYTCLGRLRLLTRGSRGPQVCYDACVCSAADEHRRALQFESGALTETALDRTACAFRAAPLAVAFTYETGTDTLRWRLGPYRDGRWYYIDDAGYGQVVPADGYYPLRLTASTVFTVRYVSPDGWSAQTPRLYLEPSAAGPDGSVRVSWSGDGAPGT